MIQIMCNIKLLDYLDIFIFKFTSSTTIRRRKRRSSLAHLRNTHMTCECVFCE